MCGATLSVHELRSTASALLDLAARIDEGLKADETVSKIDKSTELRNQDLSVLAKRIYDQRSARSHYWSDEFFGEPAWDILLDLYVASSNRETRSVKGTALASRCPHTTALRYLQLLEKSGLINMSDHLEDKRVRLVELSEKGRKLMAGYLIDHVAQDQRYCP